MTAARKGTPSRSWLLVIAVLASVTACSNSPPSTPSLTASGATTSGGTASSATDLAPDVPQVLGTSSVRPPDRSDPATADGEDRLVGRVDAARVLWVTQEIDFPRPMYSLTLSVHESESAAAEEFSPHLRALEVSAPSQATQTIHSPSWVEQIYFSGGTRKVTLRYQMLGATQPSSPSTAGRMLVYLTGLDVSSTAGLSRTVTMSKARNFGCAEPNQTMTTCGNDQDGDWTVSLTKESSTVSVYAQVDLGGPQRT